MHQFFGGTTGLSASCVVDRRVWFFVADVAGKHRKPKASLETAPLRIAVPIRHQPEDIPMLKSVENGQDIRIRPDILKSVLQINGIDVGGQIRIADANNVQGTHERFEAYVLQAERLTLQFLGNRV
jgi:hypothetical protein